MRRFALWAALASIGGGCSSEPEPEPAPTNGLPFGFERPAKGEALTAAEVDAFSREMTELYRASRYFEWVLSVSHGVDASTGKPDYALWWHDVVAVKAGDTVTFRHSDSGGGHNIYIPSSHVLGAAASGYLLTGDATMGKVAALYAQGLEAACRGFVFDAQDPNPHLMARNVVGASHGYTLPDGRKAAVDYAPWFSAYQSWNAQRFEYRANPDWGAVWVTNMRSKDDVPHIFLSALILESLAERASDPAIRASAERGLACARGFAKDIVDSGWVIRTKDPSGQAYVPTEDLASFVTYDGVDPKGECTAKLTSALLGYGELRGNDCGRSAQTTYESFAVARHFYNYHIVNTFHVTAVLGALTRGFDATAQTLLAGLGDRVTRYFDPASGEVGRDHDRWHPETAFWLVQAAAVGLPLTAEEVRFVHDVYRRSSAAHRAWGRFDLWDASVPDGVHGPDGGYLPSAAGGLVPAEDLGVFFHYCASTLKNPASQPLIDCDRLARPATW